MRRIERQHHRLRRDRGQILPLFAISLVAILGLVGLGLDAAQTFLERRDAQGAADLAALAAAKYLPGDPDAARAEAKAIGSLNGYPSDDVYPTTPYQGSASKIQVVIDSKTDLFFMPVLGINELDVDAGAAAVAAGAAASCSFCSLNGSSKNHTLLLKNGSTLRVDGDIIVNSVNGGTGPSCEIKDWEVCGDGFDIFGDPPDPPAYITAKSISVAGGWETHDENVVMSDGQIWPDYSTFPPTYKSCPGLSPDPALQTQASNVCIHVPKIADPLNNPAFPDAIIPAPNAASYTVPDSTNCPDGTRFPSSSSKNNSPLNIVSNATICPGLYYGGLVVSNGTTTMLPGLYYMGGSNGLKVQGAGSLDGTAGVTIYSSANVVGSNVNISPNPDLAKPINIDNLIPTVVAMESDKNPAEIGNSVKYKFEIEPVVGGPNLNGTIRFYDGSTELSDGSIAKCVPKVLTDEDKKKGATCEVDYTSSDTGTHGISAVFFSSDSCADATCYTNVQAILDPLQAVVGSTDPAGDIEVNTTGNVKMYAPSSGRYKGMLLFQDRNSDGAIKLLKSTGKAACAPTTETTVNGVTGPAWALQTTPPAACGDLGGFEGTIYAPHEDSLVTTTISGLANVQIISGKMLIDSSSVTRFAYDGSLFAGKSVTLFE